MPDDIALPEAAGSPGGAFAWDHPSPFVRPVTPGEPDIDGLGHTNNAVYLKWCERVAWAHSEQLGLGLPDYHRLDRAMAIRRGEYDYLLPTLLGDDLLLGTWLFPGDARMRMERRFQLIRARDGATVLRGRWELVCIDLSGGRARRMPAEFMAAYLTPALGVIGRMPADETDRP